MRTAILILRILLSSVGGLVVALDGGILLASVKEVFGGSSGAGPLEAYIELAILIPAGFYLTWRLTSRLGLGQTFAGMLVLPYFCISGRHRLIGYFQGMSFRERNIPSKTWEILSRSICVLLRAST